jgi:hypothetical protein
MLDPLGDRARHPSIIRMSSEKKKIGGKTMWRKMRHLIQKCDMTDHRSNRNYVSAQGLPPSWMRWLKYKHEV